MNNDDYPEKVPEELPNRPQADRPQADRPQIVPEYLEYIPDSPEREPIEPVAQSSSEEGEATTSDTEAGLEPGTVNGKDMPLPAREDIYASDTKANIFLEILDWVKYLLIALILGWILSQFVIQRSEVVGNSIVPTLTNGDMLFVEKLSTYFGMPPRGTIVTIDMGNVPNSGSTDVLVKRVIALPGDTIDFQDGKVILNGEALEEPYVVDDNWTSPPQAWYGPYEIPEDMVFVMGDNRAFSVDSRVFGPVPKASVQGHILVRIYPFNRIGIPK